MFAPGEPIVLDPAAGHVPARGASEVALYSPAHDASLGSLGVEGVRRVSTYGPSEPRRCSRVPRSSTCSSSRPWRATPARRFPSAWPDLRVPVRAAGAGARSSGCRARLRALRGGARRSPGLRGEGWRAYVPYASAFPTGCWSRRVTRLGLPELDDGSRNGLAAALTDVLSRSTASSTGRSPTCCGSIRGIIFTCTSRLHAAAPTHCATSPR